MTIDLDKLEAIANSGCWTKAYGPQDTVETILELIAEVRRLREALNTPIAMKVRWSPMSENMIDGFSEALAEGSLTRNVARAKSVTVYYGEKRVYTSMAEFCAAHPEEQK
jgi:hypothetical protein